MIPSARDCFVPRSKCGVLAMTMLFFVSFTYAQEPPSLLFNEIAYRGTEADSSDEWIELFNPGANMLDLSGWQLILDTKSIPLKGTVPAESYFLLERTSDQTISDIAADQIFTGALNDGGILLQLKNPSGNVVDHVSSWPKVSTRASIERMGSEWKVHEGPGNGKDAKGNAVVGTPRNSLSLRSFAESKAEAIPGGADDTYGIASSSLSEASRNDTPQGFQNFTSQPAPNKPPKAVITLQGDKKLEGCTVLEFNPTAADSIDPEGNLLTYFWSYQDEKGTVLFESEKKNPTAFKFTEAMGKRFMVSLSVMDPFGASSSTGVEVALGLCKKKETMLKQDPSPRELGAQDDKQFIIASPGEQSGGKPQLGASGSSVIASTSQASEAIPSGKDNPYGIASSSLSGAPRNDIIISRFLSNPNGKDEGQEWIELKNISDQAVDLTGWKLDNRDGGSKPYALVGTISAGETLRLKDQQTEITLRNSADQIRLFDTSEALVDVLEWKKDLQEGIAYHFYDFSSSPVFVKVTAVLDGDTAEVDFQNFTEKVRFIGVDTPETIHPDKAPEFFGKEASDYTKTQLEEKTVRLEFDEERRDSYGRILAYIYLENRFFNADLIEKGYAKAYLRFSFREWQHFYDLEEKAKLAGVGMWQRSLRTPHLLRGEAIFQKKDDTNQSETQDPSPKAQDDNTGEFQDNSEGLAITKELQQFLRSLIKNLHLFPEQFKTQQGSLRFFSVFPNPKGKDEGKEYVDLEKEGVFSLEGWKIVNLKGKLVASLKEAPNAKMFRISNLKTALKNKQEKLQLLDPFGNVQDEFSYTESVKENTVLFRIAKTGYQEKSPEEKFPDEKTTMSQFQDMIKSLNFPLKTEAKSFFPLRQKKLSEDNEEEQQVQEESPLITLLILVSTLLIMFWFSRISFFLSLLSKQNSK